MLGQLAAIVSVWCFAVMPACADEVLSLSGDNPSVEFVDNVGGPRTWQILATNNNGFQVRDNTVGTVVPLVIRPNAPTNTLFLNSSGLVGLGTGAPTRLLHLRTPTGVPTLRFEVASATPQAWDIEADHLGFDLVSNSEGANTRPFTVLPDAPTASLFVAANGSVGIGTAAPNDTGAVNLPGRYLNVRADGGTVATGVSNGVFQGTFGAQNHLVHLNAPVNQKIMRLQCSSGFFGLHVLSDSLATKAVADCLSIKMSNGNVGLRVQNPAHPLQLASGAHVTAGGVFTNASSRELKQDIAPITSEQARRTVRALQPVGYRYKNEPDENYVGFIAEDVPELVATKNRKSLAPMDIVAVLTKVVQEQDRVNEEQQQLIARQQALFAAVNRRLADLEEKVGGR